MVVGGGGVVVVVVVVVVSAISLGFCFVSSRVQLAQAPGRHWTKAQQRKRRP